jgi:hypothetical protein
MTDLDLERIRAILRTELADLRPSLDRLGGDVADIRSDQRALRPLIDGFPLMQRAVTVIQQEVRSLKAAFNDFALTNPTSGEIEALHADVNRVQAENVELATKVATLERIVGKLEKTIEDGR